LLHVLEANIAENTSVVNENVDAAKGIDGRLDNGLSVLDGVVVSNRFAARAADLLDDLVCGLLY
jgi:hypothetical protein